MEAGAPNGNGVPYGQPAQGEWLPWMDRVHKQDRIAVVEQMVSCAALRFRLARICCKLTCCGSLRAVSWVTLRMKEGCGAVFAEPIAF